MLISSITMNPDAPPASLARAVQQAEALGFEECYIADQGFSRDLYVTLAMLAGATRRIHCGPGITHPYTRHPAATAVAIATLDELSGGRAFLGIGAGGSRTLAPLQIERTNVLRSCRETVEIARRLWQGGPVDYAGEHFRLAGARINFPCRPDIPVHWAARGPQMLALGGELADVVMLHGIPRFEIASTAGHVRRGADRAGRQVRLQYAVPLVYDERSRESARRRTVYRLVDSPEAVKTRLGLTPPQVDEMRRLITTQGPAAAAHLVSDEVLGHFVLDGTVEDYLGVLGPLFENLGLGGLTVEVSDPQEAEHVLPRAADLLARLRAGLGDRKGA